jgi:cytochrome c553
MALTALFVLATVAARASDETVDRATQAALSLDAHPDRGATLFGHRCARCHGALAQGDANRAIPALAGQRFAYLIRQFANFAGAERDSDTMHRVMSQNELRGPRSWVDIAAF